MRRFHESTQAAFSPGANDVPLRVIAIARQIADRDAPPERHVRGTYRARAWTCAREAGLRGWIRGGVVPGSADRPALLARPRSPSCSAQRPPFLVDSWCGTLPSSRIDEDTRMD